MGRPGAARAAAPPARRARHRAHAAGAGSLRPDDGPGQRAGRRRRRSPGRLPGPGCWPCHAPTREEASLRDAGAWPCSTSSASRRTPTGTRAPCPTPCARRSALARALVSEPELVMLDEPASGLSDDELAELGHRLRGLAERMSVMLVEHHMDLVMSVCDDITVLDFGKVIASGTPDEVRDDPAVLAAYLGEAVAVGDAHRLGTLRVVRRGPRAARRRLHRARGAGHRGARRERRRQDHAAAHDLRAGPRRRRGASATATAS